MMDQYKRIKQDHQGAVLLFRLGDFYEMFDDDAVNVSRLLSLTLTSRQGRPMCGIPHHAARSYIARLLKKGKKVAVCEQLSEPAKGKNLIERKVVEVITPGTAVDEDFLEKGSANYLAALAAVKDAFSFAYIDLSAGDFHVTSFPLGQGEEQFRQELERLQIKEIIIPESLLLNMPEIGAALAAYTGLMVNQWADWLFDMDRSRKRLEKQFGTANLKGFGLSELMPEILSAGVILDYLDDTSKTLIPHVRSIQVYRETEYVGIDEATQRNLELIRNLRDGDTHFSLMEVLDETRTSMGRRLLKRRLLHPLRNLELINKRLDLVEIMFRDQGRLGAFRDILGRMPDLERLSSRLAMDRAHGKDMLAVKNALNLFESIEELTGELSFSFESEEAAALSGEGLSRLMGFRDLLSLSICEDPSTLLTEGNLIREGYNQELDGFKELEQNGSRLLETYLLEEQTRTGIASLRIKHNLQIGYHFEVTKANMTKVPPYFILRHGTANGSKFSTKRLSELESDINNAQDKIIELEKRLFLEIRDKAKQLISELSGAGRRIAELDVAHALSRAASAQGWTRPLVDNQNRLTVIDGRHPVVEAHLPSGEFIPNDIALDGDGLSFALITGPNMAGKSTYLRQAALITIMAQIGSFVPAKSAAVGIADRIYCRVGASDNLARGESTFLVEMNETAYILNTATEKSLVIMDEVGRGTGTNDGLSIAWAVSEELLEHIKCRTLFATHFHELAQIQHSRMANRSMETLERHGEIIFLRKLKEGPAEDSYGLHVARLAGLSGRVLLRAKQILERLEESGKALRKTLPAETAEERETPQNTGEASEKWLDRVKIERLIADMQAIEADRITPLEALQWIHSWKQLLNGHVSPRLTPRGRRNDLSGKPGPSLFD
ncbi:MAG: DNA mismatch repair protein MutS [Spirochaetaceae bacterium]|jgi:DNA mismatch repair protein MutS|nr:DNA mismatch repair protein MutS [Spirochaetaceae bacterium]